MGSQDLNDCMRGILAYVEEEEALAPGVRRLVNNRMAYGLPARKIGTFSKWVGGGGGGALSGRLL